MNSDTRQLFWLVIHSAIQPLFQNTWSLPVFHKERVVENGIIFPGVLRFVAFDDAGDCRAVCFRELRLDRLGDFIRTVGVDVS